MQKKILFITATVLATAFITSCNKTANWKCTCIKDGKTVYEAVSNNTKKKSARKSCEMMEQEFTDAKCSLSK